ncbi:MAG: VOC family protein [Oscillatoriales cyanobacterium SM2_1_8]|nr:VOC family protein [Oscillatoriales cyanobacterium SM2_1_8]
MEFYHQAFGFETRFYDQDYEFGELDAGGAVLGFGSHRCGERMMPNGYTPPANGQPSGVEIAFYTPDVSEAFEKAIGAGAVAVAEPKLMPWGQTVAYVRSVEGTIIGLCTPQE